MYLRKRLRHIINLKKEFEAKKSGKKLSINFVLVFSKVKHDCQRGLKVDNLNDS